MLITYFLPLCYSLSALFESLVSLLTTCHNKEDEKDGEKGSSEWIRMGHLFFLHIFWPFLKRISGVTPSCHLDLTYKLGRLWEKSAIGPWSTIFFLFRLHATACRDGLLHGKRKWPCSLFKMNSYIYFKMLDMHVAFKKRAAFIQLNNSGEEGWWVEGVTKKGVGIKQEREIMAQDGALSHT